MKKYLLIWLCCIVCYGAAAQQYYNEWIDYSKTYYKFKIATTSLYCIKQTDLPPALQNVPAEQFKLWRNGQEVPLYTSTAAGILPANGYIEFYGEMNDGLPDRNLYKDPANQLSTDLSLVSDTAAFFLTADAGSNLRITNAANNVSGNTLPAEQSFTYHYRNNLQAMINKGRAGYYGTNVYSSTYDIGEWWSSFDAFANKPQIINAGNLYAASTALTPQLQVSVAGNSVVNGLGRRIDVAVNGTVVISDNRILNMNAGILSGAVSNALITSPATTFTVTAVNNQANDHIVTGFVDLLYARQFNFGGAARFPFQMPATTTGYYLRIANFNAGSVAPVLYDLTNYKRYTADVSTPGIVQFVLSPSGADMKLVLLNADAYINYVTAFTQRNFLNFAVAANQADYLIISNKILIGTDGNGVVHQYAAYRNSSAGGGYNVKIYDIDELVDQFGYGIKQHPLSVKNFLRYARNTFSAAPQFVFFNR